MGFDAQLRVDDLTNRSEVRVGDVMLVNDCIVGGGDRESERIRHKSSAYLRLPELTSMVGELLGGDPAR